MYKGEYSVSLDEIAAIPRSDIVYSDSDIDTSFTIGNKVYGIPILAAAMDSVSLSMSMVDALYNYKSTAIINLCGLVSRVRLADMDVIQRDVYNYPNVSTLQRIYKIKVSNEILESNLRALSDGYGNSDVFAVSATPQNAVDLFKIAVNFPSVSGLFIQSSFVSPKWGSGEGLDFESLVKMAHDAGKYLAVGNVASLNTAKYFIDIGVDAIIEGIGPGVACSTRCVLGIGAGHVSALTEIRNYIEQHRAKTALIADGGIHNSGDIVKLLCTGAHGVILGGMFAQTSQSPFYPYHWGMSAFHKVLPRGCMITYPTNDSKDPDSVERLLYGPSYKSDGTLAIVPAIKNALSNLGCREVKQAYNDVEIVRFPYISTEGKLR